MVVPAQFVDLHAQAGEQRTEVIVFPPGTGKVDRAKETVGRICKRCPKPGMGRLDQHLGEGGGHGTDAVGDCCIGVVHETIENNRRLERPLGVRLGE